MNTLLFLLLTLEKICGDTNFDSLTIMTSVSESYLPTNPLFFQYIMSIAIGIALNVEYLHSLHHYSPFNLSVCCTYYLDWWWRNQCNFFF